MTIDYTLRGPVAGVLPTCQLTYPSTGPLGGLSVVATATAATTDPHLTIASVEFFWQYDPTGRYGAPGALTSFGVDTSSPYSATWTFPSYGECPEDPFRIYVRATDSDGMVGPWGGADVRLTGRG